MKFPKDFLFGTLYLVSGIYSVGFSLMLIETTRPISGNPAFFTETDALFPLEVSIFMAFGAAFIASAAYHFVKSARAYSLRGLTVSTEA